MKKGMRQARLGPDQATYKTRLPRELLARIDALAQQRGYTTNWALNAAARAFVALCEAEGEARAN